jgi:hypothetical protein
VEDLILKIKAASQTLGPRTGAHLKVVETYPASDGTNSGKSRNGTRTVEEEETDLSKVSRDR